MASVTMYEIRKMQEQNNDIAAKRDAERKRIEASVIDRVLEIIDTENHIANTAGMTEAYQRGYQDALRFVRKNIEERAKG